MSKRYPDYIAVGKIVKAHGIEGEVKVQPLTHYPPRFKELSKIQIDLPSQEVFELNITNVAIRGQFVYLTFEGIGSREEALALRGAFLNISREDLLPLGESEYYHFELIGLQVKTVSGQVLGRVEEVMDVTANDVLVVRSEEREYLIPMTRMVVTKLDLENEEIIITPVAGLLD
ncbi:MAG: ribosome maturation factor RimM [bacterium]